jgi:hypothetical protein
MPTAGKFFLYCFVLVEVVLSQVPKCEAPGAPGTRRVLSQVPKCEAPGAPGTL